MYVVKLLHKELEKAASIHKKRLASLFDIVETTMQTQYVTLTGLGARGSSLTFDIFVSSAVNEM